MKYDIKCDECKKKIGETDSMRESAEGGKCESCGIKEDRGTGKL